ncbi:MAG: serine hydrolase [Bacteroidota bacterium]
MKSKIILLLVLFLLLFNTGKTIAQPKLPIDAAGPIIPLRELECGKLQKLLKDEIYINSQWKRLVESKRMAIGIVDLQDVNHVKYAGLNEDNMMYAASLPKIAVLLSAVHAIENGELEETEKLKTDMRLMISKSDNSATTRIIDALGYEKIESVLRNTEHKLYDEKYGGGLWVGKRYASTGERSPDPVKGLSHGASSIQVCSFYYQLVFGKLVNKERSAQMLEVLKDPALKHKFVNTLHKIAPEASVYRKSGSWKNFHSDSVLVWGPDRRYIMVALIEDSNGEMIIRNLVVPLENVLKKSLNLECNN